MDNVEKEQREAFLEEAAGPFQHRQFYFRSKKREIDSREFPPETNSAELRKERAKSQTKLIYHLYSLCLPASRKSLPLGGASGAQGILGVFQRQHALPRSTPFLQLALTFTRMPW